MFRYEIVRWNDDEVAEILARAVDVDGLFSDPVPVARERVVLRGCPPSFATLAGDLRLEVTEGDETQWWDLNGDLVDVVASAAVRLCEDGSAMGPVPRRILFQDNLRVGEFLAVDGFPRCWHGHGWPPVTLIGVDHPERIRRARDEGLHALDRHGRIMAEVPVPLEISSVTPQSLGPARRGRPHGLHLALTKHSSDRVATSAGRPTRSRTVSTEAGE